jgi:putative ABC transport system permease protein
MFRNCFKVTLRNLLKYKTYSVINILGLTLGLFSSIVIVLFVRDELRYDTFHRNADRIYRVVTEAQNAGGTFSQLAKVAAPWGPMLERELPEVEAFVRFRSVRRTLLQNGDNTFLESGGLYADPQVFEIFSFEFFDGDPATALTRPDGIVLTESLARKLFGEQPALGEQVTLDGRQNFIVNAVLADVPKNSHFHFDFLLPYEVHARTHSEWQTNWGMFNYHVYVLLAPGADARAIENKIAGLLAKHVNAEWAGEFRPHLQSLTTIHLRSNLSGEFQANGNIAHVYILSTIAALVLLVACINFMNLATARASTRAKEVGIRKVIGAGRRHLIVQFIGEAWLISFIALLAGLGLVELSLPFFNEMLNKDLALDLLREPDLLGILVAVVFFTGIVAGSYPAFFLSQFLPAKILKGEDVVSARGVKLRRTLVVAQFAASAILLVSAFTIYRQLQFVTERNPGFNREQVIAIPIDDRNLRWDLEGVRARLANTPGVIDAAITSGELTEGDWAVSVGYEGPAGKVEETFRMLSVTHNFADLMEIGIVSGRNFSPSYPTDAERAVVVNEKAAVLLGGFSAVGKSVALEEYSRECQIVGVVRDFNFRSLREEIGPMILFVAPEKYNYFYVRLQAGNPANAIAKLKASWQALSPTFPFTFTFLDEQLERLYGGEQRLGKTVGYFTALAMVVACIGLFGLTSFAAARRKKEIGIRKVLGASVPEIMAMLSKELSGLVILANLIAWPLAWLAMNIWLQDFAYRVEIGWWTFALAGGLALFVATLTVSAQAMRAALANPVDSLRYE